MAKYQLKNNELGRVRFFELFGDLSQEEQLRLIRIIGRMSEVMKL